MADRSQDHLEQDSLFLRHIYTKNASEKPVKPMLLEQKISKLKTPDVAAKIGTHPALQASKSTLREAD